MPDITYRLLELYECREIAHIDPSYYVHRAWREREEDGEKELLELNWNQESWPDGYDSIYNGLLHTIKTGGFVLGAFRAGKLIGFCSVNPERFGLNNEYVLLNELYVTKEERGSGIGRQLFLGSAARARDNGAGKLYICAASNEDTIRFYFNLGCEEAHEINMALYNEDPRDYQMEYDLNKPPR